MSNRHILLPAGISTWRESSKCEVVNINKQTFEVESIDKIEDSNDGILHAPEKIYISGGKLFITLEYTEPPYHKQVFIFQVYRVNRASSQMTILPLAISVSFYLTN